MDTSDSANTSLSLPDVTAITQSNKTALLSSARRSSCLGFTFSGIVIGATVGNVSERKAITQRGMRTSASIGFSLM